MSDFAGKVALVTGAGSGIGRSTAIAFAAGGASVAVVDADLASAESTAHAITEAGGRALALRADISDEASVEHSVKRTVAELGRLNCAFNNAGIRGARAGILEMEADDFRRVIDVNVTGTWLCMRAEARVMVESGGGAIVNMSSMLGLVGTRSGTQYGSSKHAVVGLTRCAALELAPKGIRVNAVAPGVIETPLTDRLFGGIEQARELYSAHHPIGRLAAAGEVSDAVLWLCSEKASFVVGHILSVDGGYVAA